jgi:small-conductance mechanosensitive channel
LGTSVYSQTNFDFLNNEKQQEEPYQHPGINQLPVNWWTQAIEAAPTENPYQYLKDWSEQLLQKALDGDENFQADNRQAIRQFNINVTQLSEHSDVTETTAPPQFELQDSYLLDDVLERMQQLHQLQQSVNEEQAVIQELQNDTSQQRQITDQLIIRYQSFDIDEPEKSSLGYQWLETRSWVAIYASQINQFETQIEQEQAQIDSLSMHIEAMKESLRPDETMLAGLDKQIDINQQALVLAQQTSLQASLNMAKTPDTLNSSLIEKNKLNLAQSLMAQKRLELAIARDQTHKHWIANNIDTQVVLNISSQELVTKTNKLLQETTIRIQQWRALAQDALLSLALENGMDKAAGARQILQKLDGLTWQIEKVKFINSLISNQLIQPKSGIDRMLYNISELASSVTTGFKTVVHKPLFRINERPVTLLPLLQLVLIVLVGYLVSKLVRLVIKRMESPRGPEKSPVFFMLDKLIHYVIIFVATLAGFATLGIDFSNLTLIAGALSVGIGFGLQNIVSNFVSGLTIMFERTLKVGDYIEIEDGITGTVKEINARSTRINTNDNIDVVIPNSDLVTNQVINWTLRDSIKRVKIPFGVAYGSDKDLVKKAAVEAADKVPYTLTNMKGKEPDVWMTGFGDSSLDFELLVWVSKYGVRRPNRIKATFLWELDNAFNEYGIEIPFPQRVLHEAKPKEVTSKKIIQPDNPSS